ncbi:MAG TPA: hypothetical protein VKB35_19265, partial [Ktedonobacteraceae bacterium]|nr:hypothetical protein [Ktedonobacteraceae bacterium]
PYIEGSTHTLAYILFYSLFNLVGNGVEAGITAPLAIRIARSVNPSAGVVTEDDRQKIQEERAS